MRKCFVATALITFLVVGGFSFGQALTSEENSSDAFLSPVETVGKAIQNTDILALPHLHSLEPKALPHLHDLRPVMLPHLH